MGACDSAVNWWCAPFFGAGPCVVFIFDNRNEKHNSLGIIAAPPVQCYNNNIALRQSSPRGISSEPFSTLQNHYSRQTFYTQAWIKTRGEMAPRALITESLWFVRYFFRNRSDTVYLHNIYILILISFLFLFLFTTFIKCCIELFYDFFSQNCYNISLGVLALPIFSFFVWGGGERKRSELYL